MKTDNTVRNERIRQLKDDGKSQSQIAAALGITEGVVAGVLSKDRNKDNERKREQWAANREGKPKPASKPTAKNRPTPKRQPKVSPAPPPAAEPDGQELLPFHPLANLFPLLEGKEYEKFKADIDANGQNDPIWTYKGQILDGRNRARACHDLGLKPKFREWNGEGGSLVAFVLSANLHRRHLDSSQRAAIAVDILPYLEVEAKERQKQAGQQHGRGRARKVPEKVPEAKRDEGEARKQAAKLAGTNSRYVSMAQKIKDADPELYEKVRAGKLKITRAEHQVKSEQRRRETERAAEERRREFLGDKHGEWPLVVEENEVARCLSELQQSFAERSVFLARSEEIQKKKEQVAAIRQEAERLYYQVAGALEDEACREAETLKRDILTAVEEEHGRAVTGLSTTVTIRNAEVQQQIQAALELNDQKKARKFLLEEMRRCISCEALLDDLDNVADQPDYRHILCWWCRAHLGKTHCSLCRKPLLEGEQTWHESCYHREHPDDDE